MSNIALPMSGASAWSVEETARWLASQEGVGAAASELFAAEEVDGATLLMYAGPTGRKELKQDLGLTIGKAKAVWQAIATLAEENSGAAATSESGSSNQPWKAVSRAGSPQSEAEEGVPPQPMKNKVERANRATAAVAAELSAMKRAKKCKRAKAEKVSEEAM